MGQPKRWVIADLHFGHRNILIYENRPWSDTDSMREGLIRNWNKVVKAEDVVYVLGDFTLSRDKELIASLLARLNGRKILVMGNHDTRKPKDYIECGFEVATRKPMMVEPTVMLMHEPPTEDIIISKYKYIYGHVHGKPCPADDYGNCKCVSVERINYTPVDLDELIKEMNPNKGKKIGY